MADQKGNPETKRTAGRRHMKSLVFGTAAFIAVLAILLIIVTPRARGIKDPDETISHGKIPTLEPGIPLTPPPAPESAAAPASGTSIGEATGIKAGDIVMFGSYEQDGDFSNGSEAIEWIVLDRQGDRLFLLSKYALDWMPYNKRGGSWITWETCSLRAWLNDGFYHAAFTGAEKPYIETTAVSNEANPIYGTDGGSDTQDKVFLLSIQEAAAYFSNDLDEPDMARRVKATDYVRIWAEYCPWDKYDGDGWWWLRSPGSYNEYAAVVNGDGTVNCAGANTDGNRQYDYNNVVRPALWLNLAADGPEPLPSPVPEPVDTPSVLSVGELEKAKAGDIVMFGSYEQDNDTSNGTETIEWIVLDKQMDAYLSQDSILLLSKYALDYKPYSEGEKYYATWETCSLREWLNGDFYQIAFTETEKEHILLKNVINQRGGGGSNTQDHVFLLDLEDAVAYFLDDPDKEDPARRARLTEYAKAQGGGRHSWDEEYYGTGYWWLRSPGYDGHMAAGILCSGGVTGTGWDIDGTNAVRPAIWLLLHPNP